MKIVIFGGTFDPWTSAHQEIVERLSVLYDLVLVVPTTVRYYKVNSQFFSFNERYIASCYKVRNIKNVKVLDIERSVPDSWRFIDTLKSIIEKYGPNEYFVAMGSDSLKNFKTWYEWENILRLSKLVVFNRPGNEVPSTDIPHEYLPMNNIISSTVLRDKLMELLRNESFEEMLDEDWLNKGLRIMEEDK